MPAIGKSLEVGKVYATDRAHIPAWRVCLGGSGMRLRTILTCVAAAIVAASLAAGCGSKSSTNTVTVSVTSSVGNIIIVGQSTTLTATVTGGTTTNTAVNWQPCQFTTTTVSGTTTTTSTAAICPAPATIPTASTPAGVSTTPADVTVVATSKADNTRFVTGTITIIQGGPITFNGISPTIAPQGAALWDIYLDEARVVGL